MLLILRKLPARGHLAFAGGLASRTVPERRGSVIGPPQKSRRGRSPMELERGTAVERVRLRPWRRWARVCLRKPVSARAIRIAS